MKKHNSLGLWIFSLLAGLIPFVLFTLFYSRLPEQLAIHWNFAGEPDGYLSRFWTALVLPAVLLLCQVIGIFAMTHDPRQENQSRVLRRIGFWLIPVVGILVTVLVIFQNLGYTLDVNLFLSLFFGVLFVVIGNYAPKCRQNHTLGIRLPWTLKDQEVWDRTHRLAGFLWVLCGLLMLAVGPFFPLWGTVIPLAAAVLIPVLFSFILYLRKKG